RGCGRARGRALGPCLSGAGQRRALPRPRRGARARALARHSCPVPTEGSALRVNLARSGTRHRGGESGPARRNGAVRPGEGMHTQRKRALRTARGFTLIELMVSFSALLIVLLGFSRMLLSSHMASSTTHEATLAKEAARSMIEVLQGTTLADVY